MVTLLSVVACAPAAAKTTGEAWTVDRSFGVGGQLVRWAPPSDVWSLPGLAWDGGRGRTLVALHGHGGGLARITASGRVDVTWGTGRGLAPQLEPTMTTARPPGGETLGFTPQTADDGEPAVVLLDRDGRPDPRAAAITATLRVGPQPWTERLVALDDGRLLDVRAETATSPYELRTIALDGRVTRAARFTVPRDLDLSPGFGDPVAFGDGMLLPGERRRDHADVVVRLRSDGTLQRDWGDGGRLRWDARRFWGGELMLWRGGVVAFFSGGLSWADARGRGLGARHVRVEAAAIDPQGRVVVARTLRNHSGISVLRFRHDRTIDPTFNHHGRVHLRSPHHVEARSLVVHPDGSIVVVASALHLDAFHPRTGYVRYSDHGTVVWRLRAR